MGNILRAGLLLLCFFAVLVSSSSGETAGEMAVSDYVRPDFAPRYSDVCISNRWIRGVGYNEDELWWDTAGTPDERPFDTFEIIKMYHATRLEWIYIYNNDAVLVPRVRAEGVKVSAALTSNLADEPGGVGPRLIGRLTDSDGGFIFDWLGNTRGCVNNEDFKAIYLREAKQRLEIGATSLHLDNPTQNDGADCYCSYCQGAKDGFEATTEFYTWLHQELDAHALQLYGQDDFPIHGNNSSHSQYTDSYFGSAPDYRLDYGVSETNVQDVSAQHFHNVSLLARTYDGGNRAQVFTCPGMHGYPFDIDIVDFRKIVRRAVGNAYAQGMHMMAPFDRFSCEPLNAGDEVQNTRYFGKPEYYADLFAFIRGIAIYLDGYEFAWGWGRTPKARYHDPGTPYSDTWGTPPDAFQPVVSVADGVAVVIRAKPGSNDEPVAVHLIEWDRAGAFNLTLRNDRFFDETSDNLRLTLLEPIDNYDPCVYESLWENLNYSDYVKTTVLTGSYSAGQTTVTIPPLTHWAVLMVSKGKNTPLPLYDSPRWQQLKDEAPAIVTASTPAAGEVLSSAISPIVLDFDKNLDAATLDTNRTLVTHLDSGEPVAGTWTRTLPNQATFTPTLFYPRGQIEVHVTPALQNVLGAACLHQRFIYTCAESVGDINLDQYTDLIDFILLADSWMQMDPLADITGDNWVDYDDLTGLGQAWLDCVIDRAELLYPADGAPGTTPAPVLRWQTAPGATAYDVYLGTDAQAVEAAGVTSAVYLGRTTDTFLAIDALPVDTTHFWRVDVVGSVCTGRGAVWSFQTALPRTVAYWELDVDGSSAVGLYPMAATQGAVSTSFSVDIANPDTTVPWNGVNSAAENSASFNFDGATALTNNSALSPFPFKRSLPFTCEAFVRPTGSGIGHNQIIFGTRDVFTNWYGWCLFYNDDQQALQLYLVHEGGSVSAVGSNGAFGQYHLKHVAMVWDPDAGAYGQFRFYLDGSLHMTVEGKAFFDDGPFCGWNFMIGGRDLDDNQWGFVGQIDEVRWTNAVLDPSVFLNAAPG